MPDENEVYRISCPRCGHYSVTYEFVIRARQHQGDPALIQLSGLVRNRTDSSRGLRETITQSNYQHLVQASGGPADVVGQIDVLLEAIATRAPYYGDWTPWEPILVWVARSYLPSEENLTELTEVLNGDDLLRFSTREHEGATEVRYFLRMEGWNRVRKLRASPSASEQVFVAMWFHPRMDTIYDEAIGPAISSCGLRPYRIDKEHPTDRIDAEIIAQIRRSRVLIADVTGERAGVYYEAGFAHGLGIPVIWCCNHSWEVCLPGPADIEPESSEPPPFAAVRWTDRLHFDTRQFQHIFWDDTEDLKRELTARIRAWNLDRPIA